MMGGDEVTPDGGHSGTGRERIGSVLERLDALVAAQPDLDEAGCERVFPPFRIAFVGAPRRGQDSALEDVTKRLRKAGLVKDVQVVATSVVNLPDQFPELHECAGGHTLKSAGSDRLPDRGVQGDRLMAIQVERPLVGQARGAEGSGGDHSHSDSAYELGIRVLRELIADPRYAPVIALVGDLELQREILDAPDLLAEMFAVVDFPPPDPDELLSAVEESLQATGRELSESGRSALARNLSFRADALGIDDAPKIALEGSMRNAIRVGSDGGDAGIIDVADVVSATTPSARSEEEILAEFDSLVGLEEVKEKIRAIVQVGKERQSRLDAGASISDETRMMNFVFLGPPGTGKTTVAKLMAELLWTAGLLPSPKARFATRSDLVAGFIGQSEIKTRQVIDSARGGLLFVDEAYALAPNDAEFSGRDYGSRVIEELVPAMWDYRGRMAFVFAGYEDDMKRFVASNAGLNRRISDWVYFRSLTADELVTVFESHLRDDYDPPTEVGPDARNAAREVFSNILARSEAETFGNAGEAMNLADAARDNSPRNEQGIVDQISVEAVRKAAERYSIDSPSVAGGASAEPRPVGSDARDAAVEVLSAISGIDDYARRELIQLVEDFADTDGPTIGFGTRLPRAVPDVFLADASSETVSAVAECLLKLCSGAGLLPDGGKVVVLDSLDGSANSASAEVDARFDEAVAGALVVPEVDTMLANAGDGPVAMATMADRMRRGRNSTIVVLGGDLGAFSSLPGSAELLREIEIKPPGTVSS